MQPYQKRLFKRGQTVTVQCADSVQLSADVFFTHLADHMRGQPLVNGTEIHITQDGSISVNGDVVYMPRQKKAS